MIGILAKIPLFKAFYRFGFPHLLPVSYTISLTYACNSKCATCRVYLRKAQELSLEEHKKVFKSLGKSPYWVTFSGGEPFLKNDFPEIVKAFYDICKPAIINIPTNGILTEKISLDILNIAQHCKKSKIIVNLSIDGIGEQHDKIRNVPQNYQNVISTYSQLKNLNLRNLSIGIHTVISKFNIKTFTSIANKLLELNPDQYITEIAEQRGELLTVTFDIVPRLIQYKSAVDFLIHRIKHTPIKRRLNRITQAFRIEYYTLVKKTLRDKKQVVPCYAGINSVQIAPDGDVWICCIKANPIGNLRDTGYDFRKIWKSAPIKATRQSIKKGDCYCPLANAAYTNMLQDYPTLLRVFYRVFIKWWK